MNLRKIFIILIALLALYFLVFYCLQNKAEDIEADITERSSQSITAAGIDTANVRADGQTIILEGSVADVASKQKAEELALAEAGVIEVDNQLVVTNAPVAPQNNLENILIFDGKKITLRGFAPDQTSKEKISQLAVAEYGEENVNNELIVNSDASTEVAAIIEKTLLQNIKGFSRSRAVISDSKFSLTGVVNSNERRADLRQTISAGLPKGVYLPVFAISVLGDENTLAAVNCQTEFRALLSKEKVQFAVNKAEITKASHKLLTRLASVATACPEAKIEIAGHSDSSGSAEYNKALSQRRAEAVVNFLVQKKVKKTRLTAKGYGEAKPIASNKTPKGMAKNRRIEFSVQ